MTEQIRYQIEQELLKQAENVCREIGISPAEAVSLFFAQLVRVGGLPFRPSAFPALDEYGVTLAQAEGALAQTTRELDSEYDSGNMAEFNGKLP